MSGERAALQLWLPRIEAQAAALVAAIDQAVASMKRREAGR